MSIPEPPAPHREITTEDIRAGRMRPNPDVAAWVEPEVDPEVGEGWLAKQVESYCAKLEKKPYSKSATPSWTMLSSIPNDG